jgi:hypothetical protein
MGSWGGGGGGPRPPPPPPPNGGGAAPHSHDPKPPFCGMATTLTGQMQSP